MKIRPVGVELFHAERRTDMTKATLAFRKCCERALKDSRLLGRDAVSTGQ